MKQIIDGKRYDTDTAEKLAGYSFGYPSDFHYISEELYRTPNGAFFLHGEGGALTEYSVKVSNNSCTGGKTIVPFSKAETIVWLEKYGKTAASEKYFPESIQDA